MNIIFDRASDYVEEIAADYAEDGDPIESAGLFEGDIDNVSMDDMNQIRSGEQRVSQGGRGRERERRIQTERNRDTEKDRK